MIAAQRTGREIFLSQLKCMQENGKIIELDAMFGFGDEKAAEVKPLLDLFEVPESLQNAFTAYYFEFIGDTNGCTNTNGPFYNNECVQDGVWSKIYYFFRNFADHIRLLNKDLFIDTIIDPSNDDKSQVVIVASNNLTGSKPLPLPVVLYQDSWKVWNPFFDGEDETTPEQVYAELEKIEKEMAGILQKAYQLGGCSGNAKLPESDNYLINIPFMLSQEDIDDIMCTALEGGITSWCKRAVVVEKLPNGKPDYKGCSYLNEVLTQGGSIRIYTPKGDWPEENDEPILTIERFLKGFEAWTKMRVESGQSVEIDPANIDTGDASAIIEMALFGRIMYC